ncbi:LamG domain-containing protein [Nocardia cyriacigeorgica]|uniref:LamG domain-containing protein n=1 Tax=Nocardia cyriacigeorgica TaxID=135487 RepID=A0A6P1D4V8_9NOCA|nr:LamG-like jellyroll fold domain-containing protein [Nocardia cyriacigeorgica]NEW39780.1 LamG domain-containing protein [Nocardia cyriacigeorgica]NEW45507.1 LamG domain-containing protein [Nocardia cyriacigeorgica]NEW52414.1 LamG domain-containing protein [Nocardia cyriacigeorgica]NEW58663.1 LamG domain-containing protein [Nocardia cyriacigeorgica]
MADIWELVCHHTYAGSPGVAFDVSPSGRSHGKIVGLDENDFFADGVAPGSGAVKFSTPGARILIPASRSWSPIDAVYGEVTVKFDSTPPGGTIIDGGTFSLDTHNGLTGWFFTTSFDVSMLTLTDDAVVAGAAIPVGTWTTLGFLHDGLGHTELHIDGAVVAQKDEPSNPVDATGIVAIGANSNGTQASRCAIDEVKIWRANPIRKVSDFLNRPMDSSTKECWGDWLRRLGVWARANQSCAEEISGIVEGCIRPSIRAFMENDEARAELDYTAERYHELWKSGQIDSAQMTSLLQDFAEFAQGAGLVTFPAASDSACITRMCEDLGVPDCDKQLTALIQGGQWTESS